MHVNDKWPPFEYCHNNFVISKYSNPYQFLSNAEDNNLSDIKIYHEIPKEHYIKAIDNSCLYFRSAYGHRQNQSERADPNEMRPSTESLNNQYNSWLKIGEGIEGLNNKEIALIGRDIHFEQETESQMHWISCWSTKLPNKKENYEILETTLRYICEVLKIHDYDISRSIGLGEFKVGFTHYEEHKIGEDIFDDVFTKPPHLSWEKEFRICFHPSPEIELILRKISYEPESEMSEEQKSIFFNNESLKEFLEIPLNTSMFRLL